MKLAKKVEERERANQVHRKSTFCTVGRKEIHKQLLIETSAKTISSPSLRP
jgi:hypothetical protein